MEALTAAAVAGLPVYDMCKAMDHGIILDGLQLVHKDGVKTGEWKRQTAQDNEDDGGIDDVLDKLNDNLKRTTSSRDSPAKNETASDSDSDD